MTRPQTNKTVIAYHKAHPSATALEVAAALSLDDDYVRKVGYRNGFKFPSCRWEGIFIARDIADRLDSPALERGLTVNELSNKLLSIIAMDGLVGAILDES